MVGQALAATLRRTLRTLAQADVLALAPARRVSAVCWALRVRTPDLGTLNVNWR